MRPDGRERLPGGQYLTKKWPVLSYGPTPKCDPAKYRFKVWGAVTDPFELTWDELQALPRVQLTTDFHCVTTWSRYDNAWEGVHIREILQRAKPTPDAKFVMAHSFTGYTTNMPLPDVLNGRAFVGYTYDGQRLAPEHGGPARLVVPNLYLWKSAKWVRGLRLMERDRSGFWESLGYNNHGDPWKEERYTGD